VFRIFHGRGIVLIFDALDHCLVGRGPQIEVQKEAGLNIVVETEAMKASGRLLDEMVLPPPRLGTASGGGGGDTLSGPVLDSRS
jgi:hypothetical protein